MNWYQEQVALEAERRSEETARKSLGQALLKQLRLRFGELPAAVVTRVEDADTTQIDRWMERVITASTLEGVLDPA